MASAAAASIATPTDQLAPDDSCDYLFKIVMIGDSGVGKSCLLTRFADGDFSDFTTSTIGVDFKIRTVCINEKTVKLQVWDSAGQERFRALSAAYYRGAHGVAIVFDLTDRRTFDSVRTSWVKEMERNEAASMRTVLVGNKCDLVDARQVHPDTAQQLAESLGMSYIETSAKTADNVSQTFETIARYILENR